MRVAIACSSAARLGGVETYLDVIVPALAQRGHRVAVWHEAANGVDSGGTGSASADAVWTGGSPAVLREWNADVTFCHGLRSPDAEQRVLDAGPAAFFAHGYYGTCISGAKTHASPSTASCTRTFGPACLGHYYPRRCGGWSPLAMLRMYGQQQGRLGLLPRYQRIVVASRHMAGEFGRHGLAERTRVAPLPAPPVEAEIPMPAMDTWQLLYMGRLEWTKGADVALEAAAHVAARAARPVRLTLAGAGTQEAALRARAAHVTRRHPGLTIEFAGWLDGARKAGAYRRAHLLIVPSRWPEPFGLVGLEAAAHGVPSVAFDAGGIAEWLRHGRTGILVPSSRRDAADLATGILTAMSSPERLAVMRRHAREGLCEFRLDAHAARLETILDEAIQAARVMHAV